MNSNFKKLLLIGLLGLLSTCDRDRFPTEPDEGFPGQIVIVLEDEPSQAALAASRTDSLITSPKKEKGQQQPKLSAINQLEVRVLKADNSSVTTRSFTATGGRFTGTIEVKAQNNLKVLCIGKNSGVVERFGIDDDVDVIAGRTTRASISGWSSGYVPGKPSISPNPSTDGSYTVSWGRVTGATRYNLQESTNSSFSGALTAGSTSETQASFSAKGVGTYYYRVQANNDYNVLSGWSEGSSVTVSAPPPQITIVSIPAGSFQMGSESGYSAEKPVHQVTISAFEMSVREITNSQYAAYLNVALAAGEITATSSSVTGASGDYIWREYINLSGSSSFFPGNECWISYNGTSFSVVSGKENWPVVYVSWYGAKAFALKNGFDLPREAEWEYAARGGKQYEYGTDDGTISSAKANYNRNVGYPKDVGSYPANPFGLYDMAGNVEEWCSDWFDPSYYSSSPIQDPTGGPESGSVTRVSRGGSWFDVARDCLLTRRYGGSPWGVADYRGFRVVRR